MELFISFLLSGDYNWFLNNLGDLFKVFYMIVL